jgi:hypothetical protein
MKVNTFSKFGICVGAIALIVGTFAAPAQADPATATFGQLVGLGSDTTQDVVNGLAAAITPAAAAAAPAGSLASYFATGSSTVVTRSGASEIPRASGSSSGRDMLLVSMGALTSKSITAANGVGGTSSVTAAKANSVGMIDFARSSSGLTTALSDGVVTYIPFARDAVTAAVNPASPLAVVPFVLGSAEVPGEPSLYNIYRGVVRYAYVNGTVGSYVYNSVGATAEAAPGGTTAYAIQAYLPQTGSGTRSYFIGKIGLSEANITTINTTTPGTIKSSFGADIAVQEHDGSVVESDPNGVVAFSISQWVAQANLKAETDRRHGAMLTVMNAVAPTTGSGTSYATNPLFTAMVRDVYNIVPSRLADDDTSAIHAMFVGATSKVCAAASTITAFGFGLLPGTTPATTCGYTGLRAIAASVSTVTLAIADSAITGTETFSATVTTTSTHDQGGTVLIVDAADNEIASHTLAAGETGATFSFAPKNIGDAALTAVFVPALTGIGTSTSAAANVTVTAEAANVAISAKATSKVGGAMNAIVFVRDGSPLGGTVVLKNGEAVIATVVLEADELAASFTFTPKARSVVLNATYTAPVGSLVGDGTATKTLTVAKGTPVVSNATVATVKRTAAPKIAVTLTGVAGVKPGGTVTVTEGAKTLKSATAVVATAGATVATSKVTLTLAKLTKGIHYVTVTYNGDDLWNTAVKTRIKIIVK